MDKIREKISPSWKNVSIEALGINIGESYVASNCA